MSKEEEVKKILTEAGLCSTLQIRTRIFNNTERMDEAIGQIIKLFSPPLKVEPLRSKKNRYKGLEIIDIDRTWTSGRYFGYWWE